MPVLVLLTGLGLSVSGDTPPAEEEAPPSGGGPIGSLMRRRRGPMIDLELWEYSIRKEEEEYLLTR